MDDDLDQQNGLRYQNLGTLLSGRFNSYKFTLESWEEHEKLKRSKARQLARLDERTKARSNLQSGHSSITLEIASEINILDKPLPLAILSTDKLIVQ